LTIYSGRGQALVKPIMDRFTKETGIQLNVRYASSTALATALVEEGRNSPADVYWSQEPGTLGLVGARGLLARLPQATVGKVPSRFTTPSRRWVGTSGRSRVLVYNTNELQPSQLPTSVWGLTSPAWKGKIGIAPTNASFQAFVSAMRLDVGDERTRRWLEDLQANDPKVYEKNTPIVEAAAAGEIDLGLVNHYYLYLVREEQPGAPVANHFLEEGDPGALVSVAGVAVLESSDDREAGEELVDYLLSEEGQRFYVDEAEEAEYPLVDGIDANEGLPPLDSLQGPDVDLTELGAELESTLELLRETGYLT
jgi:iron(III) transport system substrate-binding protein